MKNLLLLFAPLLAVLPLVANDLTISWRPPADSSFGSAIGYKIAYSQVGQTSTNVLIVGVTNMATINNLVSSSNITYRFTTTAIYTNGVESTPTLELLTIVPPHYVKYPRFVGRTDNGFTLTWNASDEADVVFYKVTYGAMAPFTTNVVTVPVPLTSVTVTSNVVPNVDYYFDFTVINAAGVESWPRYQLHDKLLPPGPSDLKVSVRIQ